MPKTTAGISLDQNTQCWTIDKWVKGKRIYERTQYSKAQREKAERRLTYLSEKLYEQELYGLRPTRTFREAAVTYCLDN